MNKQLKRKQYLKDNVTKYLEYIKSLKPFTIHYKNLDHVIVDLEQILEGKYPITPEGDKGQTTLRGK